MEPAKAGEFANLTVRTCVLTNDNVLINGLILRGETPRRVLFRALGPSLPNNNRPGALRNPVLDLHGRNGELLASNDDWRDAPNAPEIEATGVAPNDDRESAILLPLPNSTTIVRGVGGTTGIALAEAYNLD